MSTEARLAYAQARLQARHGRRLDEPAWRSLEATPDLATYLQRARETSLEPWVRTLSSSSGAHEIERLLREAWRREVATVARWVPDPWRPAVAWLSTLADLEACVHLARGGARRGWMLDDAALSAVARADSRRRLDALADSPLGAILADLDHGVIPLERWLEAWTGRWPGTGDESALRSLVQQVRRLAETAPPGAGNHGPVRSSRNTLGRRFLSLFRRCAGQIPAVFAYLGLTALDLERLRAGLAPRAAFRLRAEVSA